MERFIVSISVLVDMDRVDWYQWPTIICCVSFIFHQLHRLSCTCNFKDPLWWSHFSTKLLFLNIRLCPEFSYGCIFTSHFMFYSGQTHLKQFFVMSLRSQMSVLHLLIIVSLTKQDILYGLWLPCDWQASTIVCPSGLIQSEQRRIKIPTLRPFSKYGPTSIVSALIEIPSATWPVHIMLRLIGWLIILNHYSPPMVYIYMHVGMSLSCSCMGSVRDEPWMAPPTHLRLGSCSPSPSPSFLPLYPPVLLTHINIMLELRDWNYFGK